MELLKNICEAMGVAIIMIIGVAAIIISVMIKADNLTEKQWNGGFCPHDNVRYELRAVESGHYYICPECYEEVVRYLRY